MLQLAVRGSSPKPTKLTTLLNKWRWTLLWAAGGRNVREAAAGRELVRCNIITWHDINQSKRKTSYANGQTNLGHKYKAPDHNHDMP